MKTMVKQQIEEATIALSNLVDLERTDAGPMVKVNYRIPVGLEKLLKSMAKAQGRTVAVMIRRYLVRGIMAEIGLLQPEK